jgi:hypothetical protein
MMLMTSGHTLCIVQYEWKPVPSSIISTMMGDNTVSQKRPVEQVTEKNKVLHGNRQPESREDEPCEELLLASASSHEEELNMGSRQWCIDFDSQQTPCRASATDKEESPFQDSTEDSHSGGSNGLLKDQELFSLIDECNDDLLAAIRTVNNRDYEHVCEPLSMEDENRIWTQIVEMASQLHKQDHTLVQTNSVPKDAFDRLERKYNELVKHHTEFSQIVLDCRETTRRAHALELYVQKMEFECQKEAHRQYEQSVLTEKRKGLAGVFSFLKQIITGIVAMCGVALIVFVILGFVVCT